MGHMRLGRFPATQLKLIVTQKMRYKHTYHFFLAVVADLLKSDLVGAPFVPGFLIFSPEPAAIRFFFAWMLAYKPLLAIMLPPHLDMRNQINFASFLLLLYVHPYQ